MVRTIGQVRDIIAAANTFDIFSVMLTEHPSILNNKSFLRGVAAPEKSFLQRDNPGTVRECMELAHRFHPFFLGRKGA
ncbi:hypothetical protein [Acidocella aminolytica]|jgi:hypothetical protein|uniref:hypothetical protein n=1 Tax=Acidocella aminolytica TaxID=33998 RepID=UPI0011DC850B|nr:hypothetical protein [Acidocella aminolytica]